MAAPTGRLVTRRAPERGAAAVEFALVLLPLMLLLAGIIEFGWIFNQQVSLSNAARESARYYAVHEHEAPTAHQRATLRREAEGKPVGVNPRLELWAPSITPASWATGGITITDNCASDGYVKATATIDMPSLTGFLGGILGGKLHGEGRTICGG